MATGYNVRVGDADRDAVTAQLREHYADGRLTLEELNERLDQAFAAKTKADLNTVMRDLPQGTRPTAGMPYGGTAWQGPASPGPMAPRPGQEDYGNGGWGGGQGSQRPRGFGNAFAPLMGLIWFLLILGSASPELLRQSSESLAGRLETVALEGFRLWKMPVDAGPEAQNLQKLFRFNDLSQKAGKGTPDDPTRCHDDFACGTGLKRVAQD